MAIKLKLEEIITARFGVEHVSAAESIIKNESGFRTNAVNKSSGACGLVQALPCKKLPCELNFQGADCQLRWFADYVVRHGYGDPNSAWEFWKENRWY